MFFSYVLDKLISYIIIKQNNTHTLNERWKKKVYENLNKKIYSQKKTTQLSNKFKDFFLHLFLSSFRDFVECEGILMRLREFLFPCC